MKGAAQQPFAGKFIKDSKKIGAIHKDNEKEGQEASQKSVRLPFLLTGPEVRRIALRNKSRAPFTGSLP